jgi:hypothetical protein
MLDDLRLCSSVEGVRNLLQRLGYQTEADASLAPETLNISSSEHSNIQRVFLLADHGQLQIFLFELNDLHGVHLRALAKSFLQRSGNYLLIVTRDYKTVTFVHPRRLLDERARLKVKIHKLVVDTSNPTRHDLEILEGLAADGRSPDALYQAHCQAFSVDRVTQRFYREYARLFEHTQRVIAENNRGIALFKDRTELHAFTQRMLGRIMFLYFLQKKLWLAGDPKFLTNWYRRIVLQEQQNYYSDFLEKLFFETLNRRRLNEESPWGNIPYLNGGLFDKDYNFLLHLPNELFDPNADTGILGFFLTPLHFPDHRKPPKFAASCSARPSSGGLACSNSCKASHSQLPFPRPNTARGNPAGSPNNPSKAKTTVASTSPATKLSIRSTVLTAACLILICFLNVLMLYFLCSRFRSREELCGSTILAASGRGPRP